MVAVWCSILSIPTSPVFFCLIVTHVELPSVRTAQRVATGSHAAGTIKVWNAATGRLLYDFPDAPRHGVGSFSPDGRWLAVAVAGTGWELLETTSWSTRIRLGISMSAISFSPDSAIVAIEHDFESRAGSVTLVESSSGRELVQIDDPDGARAAEIVFSPDGTQMIATLLDQPLVRIWDLRSVRRRLAELGLDWSPGAFVELDNTGRAPCREFHGSTIASSRRSRPARPMAEDRTDQAMRASRRRRAGDSSTAIQAKPKSARGWQNLPTASHGR